MSIGKMMREAPIISVLLPCFNAALWLGPAIISILTQAHVSFELIAVDDGSTDDTTQMLDSAKRIDPRVRVIRLERNGGIVNGLNIAVDAARGAYIARMDADDICMPNRFTRQVTFLEDTGTDVCGSWFVEFGQGPPRTVRWPHTEPALRAAMLFQNTLCHPTIMARRNVFERFRYREECHLVEDYDLFGRACGEFRMANVPEPLLRYRRHPQQITQAKRDAMEVVTQRIRLEILRRQGFEATPDEQRFHNLIRAPYSIRDLDDLCGIETWLLKLHAAHEHKEARRVIASQWVRACIRAAPLGRAMWKAFHTSPLRNAAGVGAATMLDLAALAATKLDYRSAPFATLRRFGLSA